MDASFIISILASSTITLVIWLLGSLLYDEWKYCQWKLQQKEKAAKAEKEAVKTLQNRVNLLSTEVSKYQLTNDKKVASLLAKRKRSR